MFHNMYQQHNLYEILEISPRASNQVIESAYRALVKKYHPDLNRGISDHNIKLLNLAREILLEPAKRRDYDAVYNVHHAGRSGASHHGIDSQFGNLRQENERLRNRVAELLKKLEKTEEAGSDTVYVICTSCGTRNRLPDMPFLNLQNVKCGICKMPFGTGNKDFEDEKQLKEKASLMKREADLEWRRIQKNLGAVLYSRIEALLKRFQEIQAIYPRVYGLKKKFKALKDELHIRNSNTGLFKKVVGECAEELSRFNPKGIFGLFKNDKVIVNVKERLAKEIAIYPGINAEKMIYSCRECGVKNSIKIEIFLANHENIMCGSCHTKMFV